MCSTIDQYNLYFLQAKDKAAIVVTDNRRFIILITGDRC